MLCSELLQVCRSVLLGCTLAIPDTRVYLGQELPEVIDTYEMVTTGVFVDDSSQMMAGTARFVARHLACVALAFAPAARALELSLVDPLIGRAKSMLAAAHPFYCFGSHYCLAAS